jgi:DNA-binding transcriptional ArsR family regulator
VITPQQRAALELLASHKRMTAGWFARRFWKGRRIKSGHWQRAGAWLRRLASAGLVTVYYDGDDIATFAVSNAGIEALKTPVTATSATSRPTP